MAAARTEVDVGGRRLQIGHLDRVVFPRTGTTKGEVLDYYVRVAGAMLPHLRDRLLHMHRYPEGVDGPVLAEGLPRAPPGVGPDRAGVEPRQGRGDRVLRRAGARRAAVGGQHRQPRAAHVAAPPRRPAPPDRDRVRPRVVSRMARTLRAGKVLVDWS